MPECMVTRLHQVIKYCELAKCHASVYFFHLCLYHGCWLLSSDLICHPFAAVICQTGCCCMPWFWLLGFSKSSSRRAATGTKKELEG